MHIANEFQCGKICHHGFHCLFLHLPYFVKWSDPRFQICSDFGMLILNSFFLLEAFAGAAENNCGGEHVLHQHNSEQKTPRLGYEG
jgi:hypothetical protein